MAGVRGAVCVAKNIARMMVWNIVLAHIMHGAWQFVMKSAHGYYKLATFAMM